MHAYEATVRAARARGEGRAIVPPGERVTCLFCGAPNRVVRDDGTLPDHGTSSRDVCPASGLEAFAGNCGMSALTRARVNGLDAEWGPGFAEQHDLGEA